MVAVCKVLDIEYRRIHHEAIRWEWIECVDRCRPAVNGYADVGPLR